MASKSTSWRFSEGTGAVRIADRTGISDEAQLSSYLRRERELTKQSFGVSCTLISLYELGDKQGIDSGQRFARIGAPPLGLVNRTDTTEWCGFGSCAGGDVPAG